MTFLNAVLAYGALAFTVPLVIHLLHRAQVKPIEWGAMHWLPQSVSMKSRSVHWKQWLLLLLRCLIPVLLALAMSRPLVQSWLTTGAGGPIALAVVLDDSMSMQAEDGVLGTRWGRALLELESIVNNLPKGSALTVVLAGNPPQLQSFDDKSSFDAGLMKWQRKPSVSGNLNIDASMRIALEWLAKQSSPRRQILVISDFESNDWTNSGFWATTVQGILEQQSIRPTLAWMQLKTSESKSAIDNVFIEDLTVTPKHVFVGQEATISVRVTNTSANAVEKARVRIDVDGSEIELFEVSLQPNASLELQSRWPANRGGNYLVHARIEIDDRLAVDNEAWHSLSVSKPVSVLLVDGEPSNENMRSETDFLKLALSPFAYLGSERTDSIISKVVGGNQWNQALLKEYRAIVLCNVSSLTNEQQKALSEYLASGNAVIFFPGDRFDVAAWNQMTLVREGGLRPGKFLSRAALEIPTTEERTDSVYLETDSLEWTVLSEMPRTNLNSLREVRWKHNIPVEVDAADASLSVAARFSSGMPWLIRSNRNMGNGSSIPRGDGNGGTLLWFTTSCDDEDSNLPSRAVFVPLMQRVFAEIAQKTTPANLQPGQPWFVQVTQSSQSKTLLYDIEGIEHPLENGQWDNTRQCGVYKAISMRGEESSTSFAVVSPIWKDRSRTSRATSSDPIMNDSMLKTVDEADIAELNKRLDATHVHDSKGFVATTRQTWLGREVWSWIWVATILCFLAEIFVEQTHLPKSTRIAADSSLRRRTG